MRVLVTGGSGFVGSAVVRQLLHESHEVINVDLHQGRGLERVGKNTRYFYVKADITNQEAMDAIFDKFRPQSVIHLAEKNIYDLPRHLLQNNVYGTFVLLEAVRNFNCPNPTQFKVIIGSSEEVYGGGDTGAIKERTPFKPKTPYAATKAAADSLAIAWYHAYQIPIIMTHASEVYGPYQDLNAFIPSVIDDGCNSLPIVVKGSKDQYHDFIFVEDYAKGIIKSLQLGKGGQSYNFGSTEIWTTEQVVELTCKHLDCFVPRKQGHMSLVQYDENAQPVPKHQLDNKKSMNELLWLPSTRFMFGIRDTVELQVKQIFESAGVRVAS